MKFTTFITPLALVIMLGSPSYGAQDEQTLTFDYKFTICPNLPAMAFQLLWDAKAEAFRIRTYDSNGKLIQELGPVDGEKPYHGPDVLTTEDINFDGCQDLKLVGSTGATGNESLIFWLFNPKTKKFNFSKELSDIPICNTKLNKARKEIWSHCNEGGAGTFYSERTYKYINNKLRLIREESQHDDPYNGGIIYELKQLRNGQLITIDHELRNYDDGELERIEKRIQKRK